MLASALTVTVVNWRFQIFPECFRGPRIAHTWTRGKMYSTIPWQR